MSRALRRRELLSGALAAAGLVLLGAGATEVLREDGAARAYEELARRSKEGAVEQGGTESGAPARDWEALLAEHPSVAAWLTVEGAGIDLPVAAAGSKEDEQWYLRHDLWGSWCLTGTAFIDHRSGPDSRNVVVYGHHMTSTDAMFSPLQRVYEQDAFNGLGALGWETPRGAATLRPLCALTVDEAWPDIQRFNWEGAPNPEFRRWLGGICLQATALAPGWESAAEGAGRCVALVTCASEAAWQPWRTVALWCA